MPASVLGPLFVLGLVGGIATGAALATVAAPDPVLSSVAEESADFGDGERAAARTAAIDGSRGAPQRIGTPLVTDLASRPTGQYVVAPGFDYQAGSGRVLQYMVEMEKGLPYRVEEFAVDVDRILNSPGGWGLGGTTIRFVRVDSGPVAFRVSLSSPELTDLRCAPLKTAGRVSCFNGHRAVINVARWRYGASTYSGQLADYRAYVVNQEVGHALGRHHVRCTKPGAIAPVMAAQTKSLEGCRANPWPHGGGKAAPAN